MFCEVRRERESGVSDYFYEIGNDDEWDAYESLREAMEQEHARRRKERAQVVWIGVASLAAVVAMAWFVRSLG